MLKSSIDTKQIINFTDLSKDILMLHGASKLSKKQKRDESSPYKVLSPLKPKKNTTQLPESIHE